MISMGRIRALQQRIEDLTKNVRGKHLGGAQQRELEQAIAEKRRLTKKRKRQKENGEA